MVQRVRKSAEYQFLLLLTRVDGRLGGAWWLLILLRAVLPAVFALSMGSLITAVNDGQQVGASLYALGGLFIAMQTLPPLHAAISANLAAKTSTYLHDLLLEASLVPAGIAHLERPEINDQLAQARDFDLGITGPPLTASLPRIADGFVEVGGGVGLVCLLFGFKLVGAVPRRLRLDVEPPPAAQELGVEGVGRPDRRRRDAPRELRVQPRRAGPGGQRDPHCSAWPTGPSIATSVAASAWSSSRSRRGR